MHHVCTSISPIPEVVDHITKKRYIFTNNIAGHMQGINPVAVTRINYFSPTCYITVLYPEQKYQIPENIIGNSSIIPCNVIRHTALNQES